MSHEPDVCGFCGESLAEVVSMHRVPFKDAEVPCHSEHVGLFFEKCGIKTMEDAKRFIYMGPLAKQVALSRYNSILLSVERRGLSVRRHENDSASIFGGTAELISLAAVQYGKHGQQDFRLELTLDSIAKPLAQGEVIPESPKPLDVTRSTNGAIMRMILGEPSL